MCAQYWTIKKAEITCGKCNQTSEWDELQTHFEGGGDGTWCNDFYDLGDKVPELGNMTVTLNGENDSFIGTCPKCEKWGDLGAEIKDGAVIKMWYLQK